ncbi:MULTISPECIES: LAGLIDADG family homing endonuclease [Bacillus cereus group]|uniref:LAGLIDADG family homing endonuclease n=1 Tax=Bacillus cereus group TaxID=86661 RepID=UPI001298BF18|nr:MULTISPECIES: LAGLIDADG family homing endonuclease [Bacillus cereus group]MDR5047854.1 hypothetical protein [Bacillus thuringiensis]MEB9419946.1 LAGLIDADG family homing endonuclease [Bacillus cereus]MRD18518.1 hypothetical protein [Bacillus thuringiensis]
MAKRLSQEIEQKIIDMYVAGNNSKTISAEMNIAKSTVTRVLNRNGVEQRTFAEQTRKYFFNESFFNVIDTEEKAYWLGFIYADGSVSPEKGSFRLSISANDIEHLKVFKEDIQSDYEIPVYGNYGYDSSSMMCKIDLHSKRLLNDLADKGIVKNKTFLIEFPTIPDYLVHHFIRGYFDGDGSVSFYKVKERPTPKAEVTITGTEEFLNSLKEILVGAGLNPNIKLAQRHKNRDNNVRTLKYCGRQNALKFYNFIYQDATRFLCRKRDKFIVIDNAL